MKIAMLYDMTYPYNIGGAEIRNHEIGRRLSKDHEVHLFGAKLWDGPDTIEQDGMTLHGVCRYGGGNSFRGTRTILEPIKYAIAVIRPLMSGGFDVIDASAFPYFHCISCKAVSAIRKIPTVTIWHQYWGDYWYSYCGPAKGFLGKMVEACVARLSADDIAVSKSVADELVKAGVPPERIIVSHCGVDLKAVDSAAQEAKTYDLIFVGRLAHQKNVQLLIRACALLKERHPGLKACIAGDGPDRESLETLSKGLGLADNVVFRGAVSERAEVYRLMKSSRVFVLPSILEGLGIVLLEAMASSLPVVVVDGRWCAAKEIMDGNGLIVKNDPADMAEKVSKLLDKPETTLEMGRKSRKIAERYGWDAAAARMEEHYRTAIGRRHNR